MVIFLIQRLLQALVALFVTSVIVFGLSRLTGSPANLMLPADAKPADFAAFDHRLGLDKPLPVQYAYFVRDAFTHGFGNSLRFRTSDALAVVMSRATATLQLAGLSIVMLLIIALPLGIAAGLLRGTIADGAIRAAVTVVQAVPIFLVAIIAIRVISVGLGWLPTSGYGFRQAILPALTLSLTALPGIVRLLRSSLITALGSEYVRFARLKGMPPLVVIGKHALRNALIAPLTYFGTLAALFLTGAVVTETVFAWPGLGSLAVSSVTARDFPVVQATVMFFAVIFVTINFLVDVLYLVVDPRIRLWAKN